MLYVAISRGAKFDYVRVIKQIDIATEIPMLGNMPLFGCYENMPDILQPYVTWREAKAEFPGESENEALLNVYKKLVRARRW
jgi:hypothetical protein